MLADLAFDIGSRGDPARLEALRLQVARHQSRELRFVLHDEDRGLVVHADSAGPLFGHRISECEPEAGATGVAAA